jgi:hypothetical protein
VGKGTKVMVVSDGNGLPIGLYLDAANHHEIKLAEPTLQTIRVPQKRGRPKTRPKELVADKAYDSRDFRRKLRRRGIQAHYPDLCPAQGRQTQARSPHPCRSGLPPALEDRTLLQLDGQLSALGGAL